LSDSCNQFPVVCLGRVCEEFDFVFELGRRWRTTTCF
jgi:hypothetical protein